MRKLVIGLACAIVLCGSPGLARAQQPVAVSSPDGAIRMTVSRVPAGRGGAFRLVYEVAFRGQPVISPSALGLGLAGQPDLGPTLTIVSATPSSADTTYRLPVGKASTVRDHYNGLTIELAESQAPGRRLTVEARAYDDGIAFRYVLPRQDALADVRITNELTEFQLGMDATTYPLILRDFKTSYEDDYHVLPLSGLDPKSLIGLPLLAELPGRAFVAITEADLDHYAGMYLQHSALLARSLVTRLSPRVDDAAVAVVGQAPMSSPWRVVMIATDPGRLIESNLVLNLNPPSAIGDASWIKAGKSAWDWWSGSQADNVPFTPGMNTATMTHYIDFAASAGLQYMLIDAGWAQKLGPGANDSNADITRAQPNIDLPALLAYARTKNVRIWLWTHWSDVERQMNEAFPLYEQWGIAGVKIDFMNRDDQWMVDYYHRVVQLAAQHHLMIDFHGAYKPDGMRRTYPNLITQEGVLGAEYNKWSTRDSLDHHVMLAFTRMLAGPMDYTPGGFRNAMPAGFEPRNLKPMVMGTRAHQLSLFVVYESPLMMVADYPEAYAGQPELKFLTEVPVTWDETRVLNARVGDYVTIARRSGRDWFVGSIAGSHAADLTIPLSFLPAGRFVADIYADAPDAAQVPTKTRIESRPVTSATSLTVTLIAGGGQAIHIRPAD